MSASHRLKFCNEIGNVRFHSTDTDTHAIVNMMVCFYTAALIAVIETVRSAGLLLERS